MLNGAGSENGNKINRSNSKQKNKLARAANVFVLFFAVVLLDYNAVLDLARLKAKLSLTKYL